MIESFVLLVVCTVGLLAAILGFCVFILYPVSIVMSEPVTLGQAYERVWRELFA